MFVGGELYQLACENIHWPSPSEPMRDLYWPHLTSCSPSLLQPSVLSSPNINAIKFDNHASRRERYPNSPTSYLKCITDKKKGVLVECDPSVKAIILKYDEEKHDYIVEDLDDDRHLVIKESQLQNLKERLGQVSFPSVAIA